MIVVTGAAGFIGANLLCGLNGAGERDLLAVDDLTDGTKFRNLVEADIADYMDKDEFLQRVDSGELPKIEAVLHQGACSATTEWNGRYMMENNYRYSQHLLHFCQARRIPFLYASSASVYGDGSRGFAERRECERPLNVYGYSKLQFDQYVRRQPMTGQVVGLRYFNVYGPREQHKGAMASTAFHFDGQIRETGECRLFEGCDGYGDGAQQRDFIHVEDVVAVNLWFLANPARSGIFNCGTGRAQTFNDVANAVIVWHGRGQIRYIPFPEHLKGRYQSYTQADLTALRAAGYERPFLDVEQGVRRYLDWLNRQA